VTYICSNSILSDISAKYAPASDDKNRHKTGLVLLISHYKLISDKQQDLLARLGYNDFSALCDCMQLVNDNKWNVYK